MEFQNGKIYTIRSNQTEKYYIGSTNQKTLAQRLGKHRSNYKDYLQGIRRYVTSFEILQYDDHYIELLELCPCNSKDELYQREGQLQRHFKNEMVNKVISGRKGIQYREDNKELLTIKNKVYRESHKEEIKAHRDSHKEEYNAYLESNKEHILAIKKTYRELHKEDKKAYDKAYRELHKEEHKLRDKVRRETIKTT